MHFDDVFYEGYLILVQSIGKQTTYAVCFQLKLINRVLRILTFLMFFITTSRLKAILQILTRGFCIGVPKKQIRAGTIEKLDWETFCHFSCFFLLLMLEIRVLESTNEVALCNSTTP